MLDEIPDPSLPGKEEVVAAIVVVVVVVVVDGIVEFAFVLEY